MSEVGSKVIDVICLVLHRDGLVSLVGGQSAAETARILTNAAKNARRILKQQTAAPSAADREG